jgi:hypothetical protein
MQHSRLRCYITPEYEHQLSFSKTDHPQGVAQFKPLEPAVLERLDWLVGAAERKGGTWGGARTCDRVHGPVIVFHQFVHLDVGTIP